MRNPIIKVSAVALIGLLSLSLTSCRIGSGNQTAQSSPEASASGNETQGSAQSEASQGSSPTASTQSATASAQDGGVTPTLGIIPLETSTAGSLTIFYNCAWLIPIARISPTASKSSSRERNRLPKTIFFSQGFLKTKKSPIFPRAEMGRFPRIKASVCEPSPMEKPFMRAMMFVPAQAKRWFAGTSKPAMAQRSIEKEQRSST